MKSIRNASVKYIISEPGDGTRYDYYMHQRGEDFMFMPNKSTLKFPQKISYWEIKDIETIDDIEWYPISGKYDEYKTGISPWTLLECIRTIKEMYNE